MKAKLALAAFASLISFSQAATMSFTNLVNFDNTTNPIVNATGSLIANGTGFVATGYFASLSDIMVTASLDAAALGADFQVFNSGSFNSGNGLYLFGSNTNSNAAFNTQAVYTVIGNGTSIATSTQLLIAKHTTTFQADPTVTNPAVLSNTAGSGNVLTLLKGNFGTFSADFGAGPSQAYSLSILIPEPSTALLGAVGALGLLRRRRN